MDPFAEYERRRAERAARSARLGARYRALFGARTIAVVVVVSVAWLGEKERLLESGEPAYYTTPHYDSYGSILVDLSKVDADALRELIAGAWRIKAPLKLRAVPGGSWPVSPPAAGLRAPVPRGRASRPKGSR